MLCGCYIETHGLRVTICALTGRQDVAFPVEAHRGGQRTLKVRGDYAADDILGHVQYEVYTYLLRACTYRYLALGVEEIGQVVCRFRSTSGSVFLLSLFSRTRAYPADFMVT